MKLMIKLMIFFVFTSSFAFAGGTIKGKIIHKKRRWFRNTVVYIENLNGDWKPTEVEIEQKGGTFIPRYTQVIVGSTVKFLNSDPTEHNVYSADNEKYDLGTKPQGGELSYTFKKTGVYTQHCKLHPTMQAYILVLQNPFYGLSDKEGNFTIENVPAGKHKLITWNERYKADVVEVTVTEENTAEIEIQLHR